MISSVYLSAISAAFFHLAAAQAPVPGIPLPPGYPSDPSNMLPFPSSEGSDRFSKFMQVCRSVLVDKITNPVPPNTILSRVPPEWTSAQNVTIANAARKYDPIFGTLQGNDIMTFYTDLCPPLPPLAFPDPTMMLPPAMSEGSDKFWRFIDICRQVKFGGLTSPPAPNTIFSRLPQEWTNAPNATIAAVAKKYDPMFNTLSGNDILNFYNDLCPVPLPGFTGMVPNGSIMSPSMTLPLPLSEPRERFQQFMSNCTLFRLGNLTSPPAPNSIFSRVPVEWTNAQNQTLAQLAQRYQNNFGSLSQTDITGFYNDLCPPLPPFLNDPVIRARLLLVKNTCLLVSNSTLTNLPAPNSIFNSTPSSGTVLPFGRHMHPALVATANATGINFWEQMRSKQTREERRAFRQWLWNRLVNGPWSPEQTVSFWQKLCRLAQRHGHPHVGPGVSPFIPPGTSGAIDGQWNTTTNGNQTIVSGPLGSIIVSAAPSLNPIGFVLFTMAASALSFVF